MLPRLPDTPFWNFISLIIFVWIVVAICPAIFIGLIGFFLLFGFATLVGGGIAAVIRGIMGM